VTASARPDMSGVDLRLAYNQMMSFLGAVLEACPDKKLTLPTEIVKSFNPKKRAISFRETPEGGMELSLIDVPPPKPEPLPKRCAVHGTVRPADQELCLECTLELSKEWCSCDHVQGRHVSGFGPCKVTDCMCREFKKKVAEA
jgi:hypothetical protein